ncbi:hypothetical protein TRVL_04551 [Trypanosoma vivax]|nr:hypothetical protein TRVL_04551 [Trypanosoma vivax]
MKFLTHSACFLRLPHALLCSSFDNVSGAKVYISIAGLVPSSSDFANSSLKPTSLERTGIWLHKMRGLSSQTNPCVDRSFLAAISGLPVFLFRRLPMMCYQDFLLRCFITPIHVTGLRRPTMKHSFHFPLFDSSLNCVMSTKGKSYHRLSSLQCLVSFKL